MPSPSRSIPSSSCTLSTRSPYQPSKTSAGRSPNGSPASTSQRGDELSPRRHLLRPSTPPHQAPDPLGESRSVSAPTHVTPNPSSRQISAKVQLPSPVRRCCHALLTAQYGCVASYGAMLGARATAMTKDKMRWKRSTRCAEPNSNRESRRTPSYKMKNRCHHSCRAAATLSATRACQI